MNKMIIAISNYDNEIFSEYIAVLFHSVTEKMQEEILNTMNNSSQRSDDVYYKIVDQDYKLYKFEP